MRARARCIQQQHCIFAALDRLICETESHVLRNFQFPVSRYSSTEKDPNFEEDDVAGVEAGWCTCPVSRLSHTERSPSHVHWRTIGVSCSRGDDSASAARSAASRIPFLYGPRRF